MSGQSALSVLDLVGVLLIGLVGALAVQGVSGAGLPAFAAGPLDALGLRNTEPLSAAVALSLIAAAFLILKSLLAAYVLRRIVRFLANRQAEVSSRLVGRLLEQPLTVVQEQPSQRTAFALVEGSLSATVSLLSALAVGVSDLALLTLLTIALLWVDPWITIGAIAFFSVIAALLHRVLGSMASQAGDVAVDTGVQALQTVQEAIAAYREVTVANRREYYRDRFSSIVWGASRATADLLFIAQLPKYVFETALVLGAVGLVAAVSLMGSASAAVGTLALFLAAGSRVMPSVLRLQVAALTIRSSAARAAPTYELSRRLVKGSEAEAATQLRAVLPEQQSEGEDFVGAIRLSDVTYRYPTSQIPAVEGVSIQVEQGQSLALVGPTGAGKSTLADLILGVLIPEGGVVEVSGCLPQQVPMRWPGAVAYVPQTAAMVAGTVRENVALGLPRELIDDGRAWEVLEAARLDLFLKRLPGGLDTFVGEGGVRLSGGQRQRLGIARALYSRPRLLVLDEATSALDSETEFGISSMLLALPGDVTTVTVAHRLATVRSATTVAYMERGRIVATGSFDEVRARVPGFDRQATLLGL